MPSISRPHTPLSHHRPSTAGSASSSRSHASRRSRRSSKKVAADRRPPIAPTREVNFDSEYRIRQDTTNGLIAGGVIAASVFMFAPEPLVTKIIGGVLSLACIAAGGVGKHLIYKDAYIDRALERSLVRLHEEISDLQNEIRLLKSTSKSLTKSAAELKQTKTEILKQVQSLKEEIDRLEVIVAKAFDQLNSDRRAFEEEKETTLKRLLDEIDEADARGDRATETLAGLETRAMELDDLENELNNRRRNIADSEGKLRKMQRQLLGKVADHPKAPRSEKAPRGAFPADALAAGDSNKGVSLRNHSVHSPKN